MNSKIKGLVAGTAGAALLLGAGGTFALWHDTERVPGGAITAGSMDVKVDPELRWYDVSPDRPDAYEHLGLDWNLLELGPESQWMHPTYPHSPVWTDFEALDGPVRGHGITLDSWRIVPGDTVLGETTVHTHLEGDNLRAHLRVEVPGVSGELADALGLRFVVLDESGSQVDIAKRVGDMVGVDVPGDGGHMFRVVVVGQLPVEVGSAQLGQQGDELQWAVANLDELRVTLEQVR